GACWENTKRRCRVILPARDANSVRRSSRTCEPVPATAKPRRQIVSARVPMTAGPSIWRCSWRQRPMARNPLSIVQRKGGRMADPVARDRQVEQLLRRVLVARPTTECVDAEQLAAWADGGLPAPQAAVVERHLGDCSDCQAMLAAFVASEPPASAPVPFWHRWRLQWLVPIA